MRVTGQQGNRRSFLRQVAGTSALLLSRRGLGLAEVTAPAAPVGPPVGLGVIGLGVWGRANSLYRHVGQFVKSGVLGTPVAASAHWARKDSWRRVAPTPAREAELNWRLRKESSPGLMGEAAIHQIDLVGEYLRVLPLAVTGFGTTALWKDGREVAATVQCVLEYPGGVRVAVEATLASSVGGAH